MLIFFANFKSLLGLNKIACSYFPIFQNYTSFGKRLGKSAGDSIERLDLVRTKPCSGA